MENGQKIHVAIAVKKSTNKDELTNLYIKNIPVNWTTNELGLLFGKYGTIVSSKVMENGIGFVKFLTNKQATKVWIFCVT